MLRDKLSTALREARETGPPLRLETLRLVMAAVKDREAATRTDDGNSGLGDAETMAILSRMVRQREDSLQTYEEAAQLELAARERAEVAVLREFLPSLLTEAEVTEAIRTAIRETDAASIRDLGKVMASLKRRHAGRMDFAAAGTAVKQALG